MCLYPKLILNPKYKSTKKNGGNIPNIPDDRIKYVPIGCQNCIECRKQKARAWQIRLLEDIKHNINAKFITLTLSNQSIAKISKEIKHLDGYNLDNKIATIAIRKFLERWRKKYKKSLRHWLVTELGHNGTQNIHLHGIIWTNEPLTTVEKIWNYGFMWKGKGERQTNYVNNQTINYIIKYISKRDEIHKTYKSMVLTSPGIGNKYNTTYNKYNGTQTNQTYKTPTGHKINLPTYFRNKAYTEQQREELWLQLLDKEQRWIMGEKINIKQGLEEYNKTLKWYQQQNKQLGYGDDNDYKDTQRKEYERQQRILMMKTRIQAPRRRGSNQKG